MGPKKCFVPTPEESVVAASGLAELLACLEMTSPYGASSERGHDVGQHPGPSEPIVKSARPAIDRHGSAGLVGKTPWSFLFESSTIRATGAGEAAVTSSGAVQGILGQRAGASVDEQALDVWAWSLEDQALASGRSEADPGLAQDAPSGPALPPGNGRIASSVAELKPSPARNAPSGLAPLPGDGQTAGYEAESEPSPARDAPSGPAPLQGDGKTAGSEAESEPSPAREAPSGLAPLPGDGQTVGSEAKLELSAAQDAPTGPMLPPGGRQTAGSETETEPCSARDAPSRPFPPPVDGQTAGSEAVLEPRQIAGSEAELKSSTARDKPTSASATDAGREAAVAGLVAN